MTDDKNEELFNSLTDRQKQVIELLNKGYHYKEIANELSIKLETVRTYIRDIYQKLQVHSRTDALNKVYHRSLVRK